MVSRLVEDGEPFLVLADFAAYAAAQERVDALYAAGRRNGARKAALNCLNMGYFSSDRSVREYADRIWDVRPVTVGAPRAVQSIHVGSPRPLGATLTRQGVNFAVFSSQANSRGALHFRCRQRRRDRAL